MLYKSFKFFCKHFAKHESFCFYFKIMLYFVLVCQIKSHVKHHEVVTVVKCTCNGHQRKWAFIFPQKKNSGATAASDTYRFTTWKNILKKTRLTSTIIVIIYCIWLYHKNTVQLLEYKYCTQSKGCGKHNRLQYISTSVQKKMYNNIRNVIKTENMQWPPEEFAHPCCTNASKDANLCWFCGEQWWL